MIEKYDNKIKFLIDFKFRNTPEELCAGLPGNKQGFGTGDE